MADLKLNITVDNAHQGHLQSKIHIESASDFVVLSLTLSLLSDNDFAIINTEKNITRLDLLDNAIKSNIVCIERPQLLYNKRIVFCPMSTTSTYASVQILATAQITTDIVSTVYILLCTCASYPPDEVNSSSVKNNTGGFIAQNTSLTVMVPAQRIG